MDDNSEFQVFIEKSTIRRKKEAHGDTRWEDCNRRPISETPFHAIEEVNLLSCPHRGSQQEPIHFWSHAIPELISQRPEDATPHISPDAQRRNDIANQSDSGLSVAIRLASSLPRTNWHFVHRRTICLI